MLIIYLLFKFTLWGLYPLNKIDYNPPIIFNVNILMEVYLMIKFDILWETMKNKSISTYQLREKSGIDIKTIRRLKANDNIESKTLNKLCVALDCKIQDIAEYVEDEHK